MLRLILFSIKKSEFALCRLYDFLFDFLFDVKLNF